MTTSPVVQFGLSALATAYSARVGRCSVWDVVRFQAVCLDVLPEDEEARGMVVTFARSARGDMRAAGETLSASVYAWLDRQTVEARYDVQKSAPTAEIHDWQLRADLQ